MIKKFDDFSNKKEDVNISPVTEAKDVTELKRGDKVNIKTTGERAKILLKVDSTNYLIKTKSGEQRRVNLNAIETILPVGKANEDYEPGTMPEGDFVKFNKDAYVSEEFDISVAEEAAKILGIDINNMYWMYCSDDKGDEMYHIINSILGKEKYDDITYREIPQKTIINVGDAKITISSDTCCYQIFSDTDLSLPKNEKQDTNMIQKFNDFLNENTDNKKFKTLPEGTKIIVTSAEKMSNEDNFKDGEIGQTTSTEIHGIEGKSFSSILELAKVAGLPSFPADHNKWSVLDNRIICSILEDEDGMEVSIKSNTYKEFEAGEINLYSCTYDFYVQIIKPTKVEGQELADLLGVQLS